MVNVHVLAVGIGTGNHVVSDLEAAGAGVPEGVQVGLLLNGRRRGDQLEGRARGVGAGEEPVQIHPVVGAVLVNVRGGIVGIVGRGAHQAFHVTGGVVIHRHHALVAPQSSVGGGIQGGVYG